MEARQRAVGTEDQARVEQLARTCATHHRPGDYVLQRGDLMRTDFGGVFPAGYYSDLARTICVGKPTQDQLDLYRILWDEHERLMDMLRPGISCEEVYLSHKRE